MALMQKKMLKYIAIFAGTVEHHSYFSWLMGVVSAVVGYVPDFAITFTQTFWWNLLSIRFVEEIINEHFIVFKKLWVFQ
jgi:hypothetical protein